MASSYVRRPNSSMARTVKLSPSLLSADFGAFGADAIRLTEAGAEYLHFDVMDNHFVPNLTFGYEMVKALRPRSKALFDVHLMIEKPENVVSHYAEAGADILTVHPEATYHIHRVLGQIRDAGMKPGVALNPGTSVEQIEWVLDLVDRVLVMTVNPGFGGQSFLHSMLPKIAKLREIEEREGYSFEIGIDGGVSPKTAPLVVKAGADVLIAGSAVFSHPEGVGKAMAEIRAAAAATDYV
jgi:ribulose-phosphate 3-epimerase